MPILEFNPGRKWAYHSQGSSKPIVVTEQQILDDYYEYWCNKLRQLRKSHHISRPACIDDWVVVHWAWEVR